MDLFYLQIIRKFLTLTQTQVQVHMQHAWAGVHHMYMCTYMNVHIQANKQIHAPTSRYVKIIFYL
jgi:hypothetical protein